MCLRSICNERHLLHEMFLPTVAIIGLTTVVDVLWLACQCIVSAVMHLSWAWLGYNVLTLHITNCVSEKLMKIIFEVHCWCVKFHDSVIREFSIWTLPFKKVIKMFSRYSANNDKFLTQECMQSFFILFQVYRIYIPFCIWVNFSVCSEQITRQENILHNILCHKKGTDMEMEYIYFICVVWCSIVTQKQLNCSIVSGKGKHKYVCIWIHSANCMH